MAGLALGAHLFVLAAETIAGIWSISPLILALLIAPLATELPEMSNSFLWLYRKKDRLAVGNVTGAMVLSGYNPGLDRAPGHGLDAGPYGIDHHGTRCGGGHLLIGAGGVGWLSGDPGC